jgi:hypothetical protein
VTVRTRAQHSSFHAAIRDLHGGEHNEPRATACAVYAGSGLRQDGSGTG